MQKRLEKIAENNITRSDSKNSAVARLNGLWAIFERNDDVLIIISADPDALASSMALKRLLRNRVHSVTIGYPNEIRRLNNLTMVERGIDTIAMLVRKLLSLGATDQGGEMSDAGEALDFVTQLLDSQFRRARIRMVREEGSVPATLAMPRRELIQVLLNLLINSRDAMATGGTLTLGCRNDGEYGFLTIADTGSGIAPEILARIFTPFFTTKGTKGTGLGLSVAESLVRGCGGLIQVKSQPGHGTTFTVQIPLVRKERP